MRRRDFITLVGGAAAWPLAARAEQSERMRRIGVLMGVTEDEPEGQARISAFREALQSLGWIEGRNIRIEVRWAGGTIEGIRAHTAEMVKLTPDVIVGNGTPLVDALHKATRSIPIVFAQSNDPVGLGHVASMAKTGRKHHRFHLYRSLAYWQMASVSGGHIACRIPVRTPVQSGHDSLLFTLPELNRCLSHVVSA
jgi:hypothetical protein